MTAVDTASNVKLQLEVLINPEFKRLTLGASTASYTCLAAQPTCGSHWTSSIRVRRAGRAPMP